jgi:hypothetical protein
MLPRAVPQGICLFLDNAGGGTGMAGDRPPRSALLFAIETAAAMAIAPHENCRSTVQGFVADEQLKGCLRWLRPSQNLHLGTPACRVANETKRAYLYDTRTVFLRFSWHNQYDTQIIGVLFEVGSRT